MKSTEIFGIIGAMESEVKQLAERMTETETVEYCGRIFYSGILGGQRVVVSQSGIGKVCAAGCAQILIDRFKITKLINIGIAGGVGEGLHVGDLVVGVALCQHDFDTSLFGHCKGNFGTDPQDQPTLFRADSEMAETMKRVAAEKIGSESVREGIIASGDQFICDGDIKRRIRDDFRAAAVEMEGGAIAQTASMANVPFLVLRAISDLADGSATESFEAFEIETANLCATVLENFLRSY